MRDIVASCRRRIRETTSWPASRGRPPPARPGRYAIEASTTSAATEAEGEAQELALHHWFPISEAYVPGSWGAGAWAVGIVTVVVLVGIFVLIYMLRTRPAGELVIVYEYRPPAPTAATRGTDTAAPRWTPVS